MSMENAILEHANALLKLAEALHKGFGGNVALVGQFVESPDGTTLLDDKAAELAGTTKERAAKARDAEAKDAQQNAAGVKPDADLEKAVGKVEDKAKGEQEHGCAYGAAALAKHTGADDGLDTPLDYAKDVRPVLLAAIKKAGKDKVQELINGFGVDKADKVDAAKFGELLAGAQLLAA